MKKYERPELKMMALEVEDIVTSSNLGDVDNGIGWNSLDDDVNVTDK